MAKGEPVKLAIAAAILATPGALAAPAHAQVVTGLRNGTITATTTPARIGGKGCGVLMAADTATVATVGYSDVSSTKGIKLCTDPAACEVRAAYIPAAPEAVWVYSATSAALRYVVFNDCPGIR